MHVRVCVCVYVCMSEVMHACNEVIGTAACMSVCVYVSVCMRVCVSVYLCVCISEVMYVCNGVALLYV